MERTSWPGARYPTQQDVPEASELPDVRFLAEFKESLMQHEDYQRCGRRFYEPIPVAQPDDDRNVAAFTYPLTVLEQFPTVPLDETIEEARTSYTETFQLHPFLNAIRLPENSTGQLPPYLRLAYACLGSVVGLSSHNAVAAQNFYAGYQLAAFMPEVDNRHSRTLELPLAMILLSTYGTLTAERSQWELAGSMLTYALPMIRRQGFLDLRAVTKYSLQTGSVASVSALTMYFFLADTVRAIHCGAESLLSPSEISVNFPGSRRLNFSEAYAQLFVSTTCLQLSGLGAEDGLALLVAIVSDCMLLGRMIPLSDRLDFISSAKVDYTSPPYDQDNPFLPLSPMMEYMRTKAKLSDALHRWHTCFSNTANKDMLALYFYCKLMYECPRLPELPEQAGYSPSSKSASQRQRFGTSTIKITDDAHRFAWQLLDNVDSPAADRGLPSMAIWLPPITFHAALVVWQKLRSGTESFAGSSRVLDSFKKALKAMPWPCCEVMVATLDNLPNAELHS